MTPSMWELLMATQLDQAGLGGYKKEVLFHPVRKWRFDFGFIHEKVAVEVEGGVWTRGRHTRGAGFISDCEKYNEATVMGWLVLRVTPEHIESGQALEWIEEALVQQQANSGLEVRDDDD